VRRARAEDRLSVDTAFIAGIGRIDGFVLVILNATRYLRVKISVDASQECPDSAAVTEQGMTSSIRERKSPSATSSPQG
jgi:hypothetical protein